MNNSNELIEIPLSKSKLVLLLLGCIILVVMSLWMFNEADKEGSPYFLRIIGMIGFTFFGIAGLFIGKKLTESNPGLTINKQGIIDNTSTLSIRLVEWKDIIGIDVLEVQRQHLILIKVRKPQKYIDKAGNNAQKRLLKLNYKEYGTPIQINVNALKIDFEELLNLLQQEYQKRKK